MVGQLEIHVLRRFLFGLDFDGNGTLGQVTITKTLDYGNAPGTSVGDYNTLATANGPIHVIVNGLQLNIG